MESHGITMVVHMLLQSGANATLHGPAHDFTTPHTTYSQTDEPTAFCGAESDNIIILDVDRPRRDNA